MLKTVTNMTELMNLLVTPTNAAFDSFCGGCASDALALLESDGMSSDAISKYFATFCLKKGNDYCYVDVTTTINAELIGRISAGTMKDADFTVFCKPCIGAYFAIAKDSSSSSDKSSMETAEKFNEIVCSKDGEQESKEKQYKSSFFVFPSVSLHFALLPDPSLCLVSVLLMANLWMVL